MAKILLTYNVKKTSDTVHTELKKELIETYRYSPKILASNGKWDELPNTCLIKEGLTTQQASADFLAACTKVKATWKNILLSIILIQHSITNKKLLMNYYVQLYNLKPGDELIVPKSEFDIIQHHALYIGYDHHGNDLIIHNDINKGVSLIRVNAFFAVVRKVNKIIPFQGTNTERKTLVQRALLHIGQLYDLINYNCQHFITEIKSGTARSRQVENAALTATGIVLLIAIFGDL